MRKLYLSALAVLACFASFAKSTTATGTGTSYWNVSSSWNNGIPADNDIIIIPTGVTVNVPTNTTIPTLQNVQIRIDNGGTLNLDNNNAIIVLTTNSGITVLLGGNITRTKNNSNITVNGTNVFTVNGVQSVSSPINFGTVALPVKFSGFSVARQNSDVLVQWSTAEEVNALSFEIERSTDGNTWNRIANVPAKGNSSSLTNYTYSDKNVTAAIVYYRIRQVDIDGRYIYTSIQSVKATAAAADVKVAAISNHLVVQFPVQVKGTVEVRVVSLSGQVISKQVLQQPAGQVILNTPAVKGAYIISVSNAQEINVAKQVVL